MKNMDILNKYKWGPYWTLNKPPYPVQIRTLNEICTAIDLGFRNIIVNANVGIGKSAMATTIANMIGDSYIVTSTTQLQSQYLHDFEDMVMEIKGRRHYQCNMLMKYYYESEYESLTEWLENGNPITCDKCVIRDIDERTLDWNSKLELIEKQSNFQLYDEIIERGYEEQAMDKIKIRKCYDCPYEHVKKEAMKAPHLVTNYFMLHILCTYLGFPDKKLFVFDEAHNFERNFIELFSFKLNRESIVEDEGFDLFQDYLDGYYTYDELKDIDNLITILRDYRYIIDEKLNKLENKFDVKINPAQKDVKYEHDEINITVNEWRNITHLINLIDSELDYIPVIPSKYTIENTEKGFLEFKPKYIGNFIQPILEKADIKLFMSGTIGSVNNFCKWNGLNQDEVYVIENKSDFPIENRVIHKSYYDYHLGKFSGQKHYVKNNKGWIITPKQIRPDILAAVKDIINNHKNTKGLIHTSNHTDAKLLKEQLNIPFLWVVGDKKHNYNNLTRDELIDEFKKSDKAIILIGPGLKDGIDLPDDYCRFNIILKVPYPGDQYSMTRNRTDFTWYMNQTIMPLMQAYGRGNRHKEDYCDTYILDECLEDCLNKYNFLFNEYFLEAVEGGL